MNFIGKFVRESYSRMGDREVTFTCSIPDVFSDDKEYAIDIREVKPKRSLEQNRLFWKLVNQIAMKQDGNLNDVNQLYVQLLKMSGAKYETISATLEGIEALKQVKGIRGIEILKTQGNHCIANVYVGSSQFNTTEMSQLIETTLNYAYEVGLDSEYWRDLLE